MTLLFYVSPLIFGVLLGLLLVISIARLRYVPGSRSLSVMIAGGALWCGGYALEFLSLDLGGKIFWAKFQYFGIATIPLAWLYFSHRYLESHNWPRLLLSRLLLLVIPVLTLVLVWTNEAHRLIWQDWHVQDIGGLQLLELHHGPLFWSYWIFAYALLLFGTLRLAKTLLGSVRFYTWQVRMALLAIVVPWLLNVLYVSGQGPTGYLDLTPFGFVITGLLLSISLFRFQLVNVPHIAHEQIFDGQTDGLIVLDSRDYIVDLNSAVQRMLDTQPGQRIGEPLARIYPDLAPWLEQATGTSEFRAEIMRGEGADQQFFEMHVTALTGSHAERIGRLIVLHEITGHKQEQARLEQLVSERTEELRQTVERLLDELAQRTLAEKRFQEVIESAPDAMLLVDRQRSIRLVNAETERLFGYSRAELLGRPLEALMPPPQREPHEGRTGDFFANPSVRHINVGLHATALRKDGTQFPVEISVGPLNAADGVWAACSVRDITERKKAEEQQNQLLEELSRSQTEQQALAARLHEVQEAERREIAGELHDRIGQNLTGINLNLHVLENQLGPDTDPAIVSRLVDSQFLVEETTRDVRDLMADLHPPLLDEYGLVSALQWQCTQFAERTRIAAHLIGNELVPRLPPNAELVLFRMAQEALNNVAKHAQASKVTLEIQSSNEAVCLDIEDDGQGFDIEALDRGSGRPHWGMMTMQQRASSIGALLEIRSAPGQGTHLSISLRRNSHGN